MPTYTEVLPPRKSSKRSAINFTPSGGEYEPIAGTLTIHTDRASADYLVTEFPTGWDGRGFRLDKVTTGTDCEAEGYDLFCGRNGQDRSCECRGFLHHGHCKHMDAVLACIGNGWL